MKKHIIIIALSAMALTACDKDLQIEPQQSISEDLALSDDGKIKKVLNGAYDALSAGSFLGGDLLLYSELLAADGEIRWEGTYNQPREVWNKNILVTNSFVRDSWTRGYDIINIANNILSAIDVVNDADKNRVKGEALFLRGTALFELVRLFALPYSDGSAATNLGVPIVLIPTRAITEESYVPRNTVAAVYAQVINDLTEAESLLPAKNGFYAQKSAAAAILSRVYLQQEDYPGARDAANRVIGYNEFVLASSYAAAFNSNNSREGIFQIVVSSQDGANDMHLYWSITKYGGRTGDVTILPKHLNLYTPGDARLAFFYQGEGNTEGSGSFRSGKWKMQYMNLSIVRLAEMYLTRAEANFRLGTSVGDDPLDDVNLIRTTHGGLPELGSLTLADILLERKLELAHEGHAIHDAKRLKLTVDGHAYNAPKLVLPIPQREVDASKGALVQNPGYGG
ncbi:MAG: RagB/SusD family nutrient uptake outer membrane protein [Chitinophagaceae bacterium]|nr:RagB/SusD family nutrient uptake outer membrane protein [Chitinophagaceae bacterium]MCW5926379.1 RagB/SusD family nutrient uptake outer membrane protein [Chitinophagaceae bacterium]